MTNGFSLTLPLPLAPERAKLIVRRQSSSNTGSSSKIEEAHINSVWSTVNYKLTESSAPRGTEVRYITRGERPEFTSV